MEVDTVQAAARLVRLVSSDRSIQSLTILDGSGRAVVHPDPAAMVTRVDLSQHPALLAARASSEPGVVRVDHGDGVYLAGFARVANSDWTAITEFPLATVLAAVRSGRELAFGVLLAATLLAGAAGLVLAHAFVRPLAMLGLAADSLASGESSTPLPRSAFSEIARLADAFGTMRDRLVARTAEREEALAAARNAVRVREEFLSIAAHELKTPSPPYAARLSSCSKGSTPPTHRTPNSCGSRSFESNRSRGS
jgi:signal transduction histidine kinase